ncbi:preprotein translocase subunit YajC [Companilactobacillus alimentarius]|nr:preprotein translocase subunit YajC [Companilactobacillus alimentarius]
MNMLTLGAGAGAGGSMGLLIFVAIMFVGMYFISIRPQKKQQQKRQEMLKEMSKGDKVVTLGGIKGVIASIDRDNKEVVVDCDGIYLTFDLNFIRRTTPVSQAASENKPADDKKAEADNASTKETEKVEPKEESKEEPKADAVKPAETEKEATPSDDKKTDEK